MYRRKKGGELDRTQSKGEKSKTASDTDGGNVRDFVHMLAYVGLTKENFRDFVLEKTGLPRASVSLSVCLSCI